MKRPLLFLLFIISNITNLAFADGFSFKLGTGHIFYNDVTPSEYRVVDVQAHTYARTEGLSLSMKGCYEKKEETGDSFPFHVSYIAHGTKDRVATSYNDNKILVLESIKDVEKRVRKRLRKKVPFYCNTGVETIITITIKFADELWRTHTLVERKGKKYYGENAAGKKIELNEQNLLSFHLFPKRD